MLLWSLPAIHLRKVLFLFGVPLVSQLQTSESGAAVEGRMWCLLVSLILRVWVVESLDEARHWNCSFLTSHYQLLRKESSCLDGWEDAGVEDALAC